MREKKFTPGPWKYRAKANYCGGLENTPINGMGVISQKDEIQFDLCQMCDFPEETLKANAHLISAAPELLEALENLKELIQQIEDGDRPYNHFDVDLIDDAIAKAYGEPHG